MRFPLLLLSILTSSTAWARPVEPFVDAFISALHSEDLPSAKKACSQDFLEREHLNCAGLVKALTGPDQVKRGRLAENEHEALVELWMVTPSTRFPVFLLAKRDEGEWLFVDGTDGDGPSLDTALSLDKQTDPNAPVFPDGLSKWLKRLHKGKPRCTAEATETCDKLKRQSSHKGLSFQPTHVEQEGDRLVLQCLVLVNERPMDEVWMTLINSNARWLLTGMGEDPAVAHSFLLNTAP